MPKNLIPSLLSKALNLSSGPGCYFMKNKLGDIIYVGKAKNLKLRVSSYFNDSPKSLKTEHLVANIFDFDFALTKTEAEALILENNLIKQFSPKYNIRLRDDKTYPYLEIKKTEKYPRLLYSRKPNRENSLVFGPFATGSNLKGVIKILNKIFGLRDCTLSDFNSRKTPCLLYQMGHCSAPCVGKITSQDYEKNLMDALSLFNEKSKGEKVFLAIREKMELAADKENFEKAAQLRDHLEELKRFFKLEKQQNAEFLSRRENIDLVALYSSADNQYWDFEILMVRNGLQLGRKHFYFDNKENLSDFPDLLFSYYQFQEDKAFLPEKIIVDLNEEKRDLLEKAFRTFGIDDIQIKDPRAESSYESLYQMALLEVMENQRIRLGRSEWILKALISLKNLLSLSYIPQKIECYDVAIWQGKTPTASQIVFENGDLNKKAYRYYHLKERAEGNNDFAMLKEFLERRIPKGDLPDLILVDGGLGQVNSLKAILKEHNLEKIIVIGIAKARNEKDKKTKERLIIPNRKNDYILEKDRPLLRLMVTLRNEAHRFSRVLHHKGEKKRVLPKKS